MTMFVKICGMTDAAAVAAATEAGADALGFVFADSVRRLAVDEAVALAKPLPEGTRKVAVMMHPSKDEFDKVMDLFRPDVLQTDVDDFDYLEVPEQVERWPVLREGTAYGRRELPELFVYEGKTSGSGEIVDWSVAAALAKRGRMILAGGLDARNISAAIAAVAPYGVDVSSGVESAPGRKDPAKIRTFIDAARNAGSGRREQSA